MQYGWCVDRRTRKGDDWSEGCGCFPSTMFGKACGTVDVLLTCRIIYTDLLNYIFSTCTFRLESLDSLLTFALCTPTSHLSSLHSLELPLQSLGMNKSFLVTTEHLPIPYQAHFKHLPPLGPVLTSVPASSVPAWYAACEVLARIPNLRDLRIRLSQRAFFSFLIKTTASSEGWPGEDFVFKPLDGIALEGLRSFVVEVDWPQLKGGWDQKEKRFQLRRKSRNGDAGGTW